MKKIMLFCAAALAFAACTNDLAETADSSIKSGVTLEGGFTWNETKTAFTDAEAPTNPLVWSKDDAIGIFTTSGETININYRANILRSSVGSDNGVFIPVEPASEEVPGLQLPEDGAESEEFLIYYPYSTKVDINVDDYKIHYNVAEIQTQDEVSDKQIGKNGFSYGFATVASDTKKINFTLTHAMSYMRFVVASSD